MDDNKGNLTIVAALLGAFAILVLLVVFILLYR
jgi:hypothetical protein